MLVAHARTPAQNATMFYANIVRYLVRFQLTLTSSVYSYELVRASHFAHMYVIISAQTSLYDAF